MNPDGTPIVGENPPAPAPSNAPSTPPAPVTVNSGQADVEQARKEAEQTRLRNNQLENELKKMRDDQETARQKQLEEKEEFKTLYEQTQSRLKEIEDEKTRSDQQAAVATATQEVLKDYPANVVELAKTAGLSLTDDSEAAKASLKEKLDSFKATLGTSPITPNNPGTLPTGGTPDDLVKREDPWAGSPMSVASANGNLQPQYEYIRGLSAIQRMKEIAKGA